MRSRIAALTVTAALGAVAVVVGTGATAQAATRPAVTRAQCTAAGGVVFDIPLKTTFCLWDNHDGTIDTAAILPG
ncbi:hypothetical protein AB0F77_39910 [Streptomyces sp. NPDC026672]|uniref:hypothetical protein n=1 Tax=unclassified Streptomyces TaxID=2593676 RepID=UPI0033F422C9